MYLNLITEKVYVGSTLYGLAHRHKGHLKSAAQAGDKSKFHRALADWSDDEYWDVVILQRCSTVEELDAAEKFWISETHALDDSVGYNTYSSTYLRSSVAGAEAMKRKRFTAEERANRSAAGKLGAEAKAYLRSLLPAKLEEKKRFKDMTREEQSAYLSAAGKKGAAKVKRRADMTPEEIERFREWGRKGAAKSKALAQSALLRCPVGTAHGRVGPEVMTVAGARGFHRGAARFPVCPEPLRHGHSHALPDDGLPGVALGLRGHDLSILQSELLLHRPEAMGLARHSIEPQVQSQWTNWRLLM